MKFPIAKLLYIVPLIFTILGFQQIKVVLDSRKTLEEGQSLMANINRFDIKNMVAQTHGMIDLEIPIGGGKSVVHKMTLEGSWAYHLLDPNKVQVVKKPSNAGKTDEFRLKDSRHIAVHYLAGSGQEVVIDELARIQQRTAMINAATTFTFALMLFIPIFLWNRYLKKHGDPAYRKVEA